MPQGNDVAHNVLGVQAALKAVDLDVMEGIPGLRDKAVLHALAAAGKVDLGGRVGGFQGTSNGQRILTPLFQADRCTPLGACGVAL